MMPKVNKSGTESLFILLYIISGCICLLNVRARARNNPVEDANFAGFYTALESKEDSESITIGEEIFGCLERKYRADTGFGALKSKLAAAEFLAGRMVSQLRKATSKQIFAVAGELFEAKEKKDNPLAIAPAKSFYETSVKIFSKPVKIGVFGSEEKKFLTKFYDLKLRVLTSSIARAGQALAIAEPDFKGTHNYVLVLPLLHTSEQRPVNIDVLPKWMRQPQQLDVFSDSCLLHYGLSFHAQVFARESAKLQQKEFSQEEFYRTAAIKCAKQFPRVAVDCLQGAIDSIAVEKIDKRIDLQFEIVRTWLDSGNFTLAAGEAKKISEAFGQHQQAGKAIWLYYYALSRANNIESLLVGIDSALEDPRCSAYRAKLMYIKWWALRRQRSQIARVAALEHKLLKEFGNDPMVAPILLSRASDLLAAQDYSGAIELLDQLQEKFPTTNAARQAKKMAQRLKAAKGSK